MCGQSLRRATELFAQAGVVPEVKGDGLVVVRQEPAAGSPCLDKNGKPLPCVVWMADEEGDAELTARAENAESRAAATR